MKKLTVFAVAAIIVFIFSSSSHAYTVYIDNYSDLTATVEVEGEHLFWRQIDCTAKVNSKSEGTCVMPVAICPVSIYVTWYDPKTNYTYPKELACKGLTCLNIGLIITQRPGYYPKWTCSVMVMK